MSVSGSRLLAFAFLVSGCVHGGAQIVRDDWCSRVESFKEDSHWRCTWPPSRYAPGDFGPTSNPSRYNIVGAVFGASDPSLRDKASVRKIGTLDLSLTKTVSVV